MSNNSSGNVVNIVEAALERTISYYGADLRGNNEMLVINITVWDNPEHLYQTLVNLDNIQVESYEDMDVVQGVNVVRKLIVYL